MNNQQLKQAVAALFPGFEVRSHEKYGEEWVSMRARLAPPDNVWANWYPTPEAGLYLVGASDPAFRDEVMDRLLTVFGEHQAGQRITNWDHGHFTLFAFLPDTAKEEAEIYSRNENKPV